MRLAFAPAPDASRCRGHLRPGSPRRTCPEPATPPPHHACHRRPCPLPCPHPLPPPRLTCGGDDGIPALPVLDTASIRRTATQPMAFEAPADAQRVTLVPVASVHHEPYTVYWQST